MVPARWIDLGRVAPLDFHAAYTGLAYAQGEGAVPVVVCGQAGAHISLGQSQTLIEVDDAVDVPVVRRALGGGAVWVDEHQLSYAIIARLAIAPQRHEDWYRWALAPAIATFGAFGLAVHSIREDLWLGGRKIAGSGAATLERSAVVASSFLLRFPRERFASAMASPSAGYRNCVREGLAAAMTDWESETGRPDLEALSAVFIRAIRSELGWRVALSAPDAREAVSIADWRAELAEPIEQGKRGRVHDGLKLNAELCVVAAPGGGARLVRGNRRG